MTECRDDSNWREQRVVSDSYFALSDKYGTLLYDGETVTKEGARIFAEREKEQRDNEIQRQIADHGLPAE